MAKKTTAEKKLTNKPKGVANRKGKTKAKQPWLSWKTAAQGAAALGKMQKAHGKATGAAKSALTKGMAAAKKAIKNLKAKEYRSRLKTVNNESGGGAKRGPKDSAAADKSSTKGKKTEKTSKTKKTYGRFKYRSRKRKK